MEYPKRFRTRKTTYGIDHGVATGTGIRNGVLVALNSEGLLTSCDGDDTPLGYIVSDYSPEVMVKVRPI